MLTMSLARCVAGSWRTISIFLFLFPTLSFSFSTQWDEEGASRAFSQASQQWDAIKRSEKAVLSDYLHCARSYRDVYVKNPHFRGAGEAIYREGVLYQEAARKFDAPEYYRSAARRLRLLAMDYPGNPNSKDALLRLGEIYALHLKDSLAAEEIYRLLKTRYRYSDAAMERIRPAEAVSSANALSAVRNIRFWTTDEYTRVSIDIDSKVKYVKGRLASPDRIYFDIAGARLDGTLFNKTFNIQDRLLKKIRVAQNKADVVRVVLDVSRNAGHTVYDLENPFRITIDLRESGSSPHSSVTENPPVSTPPAAVVPEPAPVAAPEAKQAAAAGSVAKTPPAVPAPKATLRTSQGDSTLTRMLGLKIGRIVIDPGHGGNDLGTVGPGGLLEKDLVLSLGLGLKSMIEEKVGADVVLTRGDDTFVPLEERTAIANRHKADLFISIHANSSRNRSVSGVETYYLDFAKTDAEREIAARENATAASNVSDLENLIKKIAQADKSAESKELASIVQKQLYAGSRKLISSTQNRGVRSAPFVVLIGANMPSVLAEVAFISNPRDERLLARAAGKEHLIRALFSGIESYMKTLGSDVVRNQTKD